MDGIDHAKYFAIHAFAFVIQLKVIKIIRDSDVISLRPLHRIVLLFVSIFYGTRCLLL